MRTSYRSNSYAMDEPRFRGWTREKVVKFTLGETLIHLGVLMGVEISRDDMDIPANIRVEVFDEDDYHIHVDLHLEGGRSDDQSE